jgi:hypothetical protein
MRTAMASPNLRKIGAIVFLLAVPLFAREKSDIQYGSGLVVNLPFPESEVARVVQDVGQNGIIRGTKEYNKDEYITGAKAAISTRVFSERSMEGQVFYKVRLKALGPRNFRNSSDLGTLAVRYVVHAQDDKHTVLRIDARFVEDFRQTSHPSNGSVEAAEYKDVHDRLDSMELMKAATAEAEKQKQAASAKYSAALTDSTRGLQPANSTAADHGPAGAAPTEAEPSAETLGQRLQQLRQQVERLVKAPGAPLKAAPFHTANTLESLPAGTEVLIVVSTSYWFGVETHEGRHGWMLRDDLEPVK